MKRQVVDVVFALSLPSKCHKDWRVLLSSAQFQDLPNGNTWLQVSVTKSTPPLVSNTVESCDQTGRRRQYQMVNQTEVKMIRLGDRGLGTTGVTLSAGLPTLDEPVKHWFFFFGLD